MGKPAKRSFGQQKNMRLDHVGFAFLEWPYFAIHGGNRVSALGVATFLSGWGRRGGGGVGMFPKVGLEH